VKVTTSTTLMMLARTPCLMEWASARAIRARPETFPCEVREKLIAFLQAQLPQTMPRSRIDIASP
jgi:hypothetical protein